MPDIAFECISLCVSREVIAVFSSCELKEEGGMTNMDRSQGSIERTPWGLTITGTRITLYDVMDYLTADWPPPLIQSWLNLSDRQIADAVAYIAAHRAEVEAEYHQVLQRADEIRTYWEARNRQRLAQIAAMPVSPQKQALKAKLDAWKANLKLAA